MEFTASAEKHGILRDDIAHAVRHALVVAVQDVDGDSRSLVIGPDRHGALLEVVLVVSDGPVRAIHADRLRRKFYYLLEGDRGTDK